MRVTPRLTGSRIVHAVTWLLLLTFFVWESWKCWSHLRDQHSLNIEACEAKLEQVQENVQLSRELGIDAEDMAILNCQEIWGTFPDFRGWLMANPLRILTPGSKSLYANMVENPLSLFGKENWQTVTDYVKGAVTVTVTVAMLQLVWEIFVILHFMTGGVARKIFAVGKTVTFTLLKVASPPTLLLIVAASMIANVVHGSQDTAVTRPLSLTTGWLTLGDKEEAIKEARTSLDPGAARSAAPVSVAEAATCQDKEDKKEQEKEQEREDRKIRDSESYNDKEKRKKENGSPPRPESEPRAQTLPSEGKERRDDRPRAEIGQDGRPHRKKENDQKRRQKKSQRRAGQLEHKNEQEQSANERVTKLQQKINELTTRLDTQARVAKYETRIATLEKDKEFGAEKCNFMAIAAAVRGATTAPTGQTTTPVDQSKKEAEHHTGRDRNRGRVTCYRCGRQGHYRNTCRTPPRQCMPYCGRCRENRARRDCPRRDRRPDFVTPARLPEKPGKSTTDLVVKPRETHHVRTMRHDRHDSRLLRTDPKPQEPTLIVVDAPHLRVDRPGDDAANERNYQFTRMGLDSGAEISVARAEALTEEERDFVETTAKQTRAGTIIGATGHEKKIVGTLELKMIVVDPTTEEKTTIAWPFLAVAGLPIEVDFILGYDFMRTAKLEFCYDKPYVQLQAFKGTKWWKSATAPPRMIATLGSNQAMSIGALTRKDDCEEEEDESGIGKTDALTPPGISEIRLATDVQQEELTSDGLPVQVKAQLQALRAGGDKTDFATAMETILRQNKSIFELPRGDTPARVPPVEILLKDQMPVREKARRKNPKLTEAERRQVQQLLDRGFIQPSKSPYASPTLFVTKKDGAQRFCIDYRRLNDLTIADRYPMRRTRAEIEDMVGKRVFTQLDGKDMFWQIPLKPADRHKTAFITGSGLFEWKVLPFGWINSPAALQRNMDSILAGAPATCYMDDIVIASETREQHVKDVEHVLGLLREYGIRVSPKKCFFAKERIKYLGHIVDGEGCRPDPDKVKALREWTKPCGNATDVRAFLGFTGYYRRFIKDYAKIAKPLTSLTKKGTIVKREWGPAHDTAFKTLKNTLSEATLLHHPNWELPFLMHTDASQFAIGAALSQSKRDNQGNLGHFPRFSRMAHGQPPPDPDPRQQILVRQQYHESHGHIVP